MKSDRENSTNLATAPNGQIRSLDATSHRGYLITRDQQPYFVDGNCIYVVGNGWNSERQQLRPEFNRELRDGVLSPDFCFPLQSGRDWGNNDVHWNVVPTGGGNATLPGIYVNATHIFSNHIGGGRQDVWFQKGVGVVAEHYFHVGSYDEYTKTLKSFNSQ